MTKRKAMKGISSKAINSRYFYFGNATRSRVIEGWLSEKTSGHADFPVRFTAKILFQYLYI
jgi:hypothetical protein